MKQIRVMVVDDAVVVRRLVTEAVQSDARIEVVGTAANGRIALAKLDALAPDLVILDFEMPEMDGLATLKAIRGIRPRLPVIMCSTLTARGASVTLDALALGANDYVTKPTGQASSRDALNILREQLVPKILSLVPSPGDAAAVARPAGTPVRAAGPAIAAAPRVALPAVPGGPVDLVAIGVSTGGPNALATVIPRLPITMPVPVVIVQHMPPLFTRLLAERLDKASALAVVEASEGLTVLPGMVVLAPGDWHVEVRRTRGVFTTHLHQGPPEHSCRPAVDVLFRSLAACCGSTVLAAVLTGMGRDGLSGAEQIRRAGGQVIVQDEATSVVWGMPGFIANAGLAQAILPLDEIAPAILGRVGHATREVVR